MELHKNILSDQDLEQIRKDQEFVLSYLNSDERKAYSAQRVSNDVGDITQAIIGGRRNIELFGRELLASQL